MLNSWQRWLISRSKAIYYLNCLAIKWNHLVNERRYSAWLRQHLYSDDRSKNQINEPVFSSEVVSIFLMVGKDNYPRLETTLRSLARQNGSKWKLYLLHPDDLEITSTSINQTQISTESFQSQDENSLIETINHILVRDTGEFVTFISAGDALAPDALSEAIRYFRQNDRAAIVYSDEDRIDNAGKRSSPIFKPGWSPDLLLSYQYMGHLTVYRKEEINRLGGLRQNSFLASEYDLMLNIASDSKPAAHLPSLLYSRADINSTISLAQQNALKDQVKASAEVESVSNFPGYFRIHWPLKDKPLISILICTRDKADYLNKCLTSIFTKSVYQNFEVVIIDNGSREERTRDIFKAWQNKEPDRFHSYSLDIPFNFSTLNNNAVTHANGELLLFLNNDIEVISPDWLEEMGGQAQRPSTGAVSVLLLYPNRTVQHAGIIVGGASMAVHSHHRFPVQSPGYMGRLVIASNYSAVTAACMMIKKDLFLAQGKFDENLAIAYGDVELCLRLRNAGYNHVVLPYVQLYHHESTTRGYENTEEKLSRMAAEKNYVVKRWPALLHQDKFYHPALSGSGNFMFKG